MAKETKANKVYGILIKPDLTVEKVRNADFGAAVGGYVQLVPRTTCKRYVAYCDEEGLLKDVDMNDLAAYVLDILGFDLRSFAAGVRGNIVIANDDDEVPLPFDEVKQILELCQNVQQWNENDDGDEDEQNTFDEIANKYDHLRSRRL